MELMLLRAIVEISKNGRPNSAKLTRSTKFRAKFRADKNRYYTLILAKRPRSDTAHFSRIPHIIWNASTKRCAKRIILIFTMSSTFQYQQVLNLEIKDVSKITQFLIT